MSLSYQNRLEVSAPLMRVYGSGVDQALRHADNNGLQFLVYGRRPMSPPEGALLACAYVTLGVTHGIHAQLWAIYGSC